MDEYNQIEERLISNIAAIPIFERAGSFEKFTRRNEASIFNALFYDKETVTEDAINERVCKTANFFNLPIPMLLKTSECLAQISFSEITELGSEIRYNLSHLEELGINNLDAFDAILTHEIGHQFLSDFTFNFCINQNWAIELACDYFVGYRFGMEDLPTGKYKYVVGQLKESESHPSGIFRINAVMCGYELGCDVRKELNFYGADYALMGVNLFLCYNSKFLNDSYRMFLNNPISKDNSTNQIMSSNLPDSNLIKRFVLAHN